MPIQRLKETNIANRRRIFKTNYKKAIGKFRLELVLPNLLHRPTRCAQQVGSPGTELEFAL